MIARCLAAALGLVFLPLTTSAGQAPSRDWRPEDRTVIGDFSRVTSVAASLERVFITSPSALLVWRPQAHRWEGPFEPPDPPAFARVFASLVDPLDNSLWLARPDGWVHYQPDLTLWDQGEVASGVRAIAFDAADPGSGLFLRTDRGWELLPRGGLVATPAGAPRRPVGPATMEQAARANPTLQANAAQILSGPGLRTVRYTAAAPAADGRGWYLGTSGVGTLFLSDAASLPERLTFGLPAGRIGSVLSWPGGVWASNDQSVASDAGVTFVASDLSDFRNVPGPSAVGPPFNQVWDLAGLGAVLWAATDRGAARIDPRDGRVELVGEGRGLPDGRIYSISARQGRVVVGTARGVARISQSMVPERIAPSFAGASYGVLPAGDSLWLATSSGVLLVLPGGEAAVRPAALAGSPSLQGPALALATLGDTVVALTRDHLLWRDPRTRRWVAGPNLSGLLGRLRALAADGPGFWVAGERAVGFAGLATPPIRSLQPGDLPGAVNDLAVDEEYLWSATDGGLVRFRLDAIRP